MAMISGGDESARNAFRAYLRDDSSQLSIISTEEMTAGDVLEVKNLADAIERAERVMRESSRPRDMFAELGGEVATDDASGPAVYAKPTLTPVPPSLANVMATPLPLPPTAPAVLSTQPIPAILYVPNEEDAFLQPAGRMRHFAEETLDGYRPDGTLELRLKGTGERRKTFTAVIGVLLAVVAIALVAGSILAFMPKAEAQADTTVKVEARPVPAAVETASPKIEPKSPPKESAPSVPTMNVNDLPTAR